MFAGFNILPAINVPPIGTGAIGSGGFTRICKVPNAHVDIELVLHTV